MPQFTASSAIISLSGWDLILHCPRCGPKQKCVDDVLKPPTRGSMEIGRWLPKLVCRCGQRPSRVEAVCTWIVKFGKDPLHEDLTRFAVTNDRGKIAA